MLASIGNQWIYQLIESIMGAVDVILRSSKTLSFFWIETNALKFNLLDGRELNYQQMNATSALLNATSSLMLPRVTVLLVWIGVTIRKCLWKWGWLDTTGEREIFRTSAPHPSKIKLDLYRFVVDWSQMTWTGLIWGLDIGFQCQVN